MLQLLEYATCLKTIKMKSQDDKNRFQFTKRTVTNRYGARTGRAGKLMSGTTIDMTIFS
ncbi:hypothetical protein [Spirosoma migulaei]